MINPLAVRTIVLASGERFPILLERASGVPLFEPAVYSVTELRATNKAANTIEHALRSVMLLLLFLKGREIDLEQRMRGGLVLDVGEIDALVALCKEPVSRGILASAEKKQLSPQQAAPLALEKFRSIPKHQSSDQVCGVTVANRIRAIRDYLGWLVYGYLSRRAGQAPRAHKSVRLQSERSAGTAFKQFPVLWKLYGYRSQHWTTEIRGG